MQVGGGFTAGAMLQCDVRRSSAGDDYESAWLATAFAQRPLAFGLSLYGEATLEAASGGSDPTGNVGVGALWQLNDRLSLDYELMRGINRRAGEWTHVARVTWDW